MTDEEKELEEQQEKAFIEYQYQIEEAKELLTKIGYTVLEWQTGEPDVFKPILVRVKDSRFVVLSYMQTIQGESFYNYYGTGLIFPDSHEIIKWAYLPEGEQK